jgi:fucose 4-O-acetylase-like acetyltransferase
LLSLHPYAELFTKPVGRYETARVFLLGEGAARAEKSIPYYNLRLILSPAILSLAVLAYAAFAAARPLLDRIATWGLRMGRRSLDVYILHLAILAIFVTVGGKRPLKLAWQGDAVFLGVLAVCYGWVSGRDVLAARKRARLPVAKE